jgi:hypothetical protein
MISTKRVMVAILVIGLTSGVPGAALAGDLITNGGFENLTNPLSPGSKDLFANVGPIGWSGGGGLTFVDTPGSADNGTYLSVYGPFPAQSPAGGNFVMADGDPSFSGSFSQTINGLTAGQTYAVSFYQAAGQQVGFSGATFEQWQVSLGSQTQFSSAFNLPGPGGSAPDFAPWQAQTLYFTADGSSDVLSFLAVGGPTLNSLPPIAFLDGVSMQSVPEPTSMLLFGLGVFALCAFTMCRRRAVRAAA